MRALVDILAAHKVAVSGFILAILVSQAIVGVTYHGGTRWPIISYPMYSGAKQSGDRFDDYNVYVVPHNGQRILINPADIGMTYWIFRKNIIRSIFLDDVAALDPIRQRYCSNDVPDEIHVQLLDTGVYISGSGPVYGEPAEIKTLAVPCAR